MGFFVADGQRMVSGPTVRPQAGALRWPQEAEHELRLRERSGARAPDKLEPAAKGRACGGRGWLGQGWVTALGL